MDYNRQPCPIRIVEDCGCAFVVGSLGGGLFQFATGFRNSPTGLLRGLYGGLDSMKMRTPAIAGSFAVWGATFSIVDCAMVSLRQREDSWNSIVSGAATGGILAARSGMRAMANSAFVGCIVLAMIEGAGAAVATIYAANEGGTITINDQPSQRAQWEPITYSSGQDFIATGFERVLEKCRKYRDRNMTLSGSGGCLRLKKPSHSLLDLIKMAEII
ncbi:probable mitochondrial import inner membrane translocase subunit Tim17 4 [Drosophila kikkawai]|uniref:Probable mitochondrial import inner membrane translocase subunit Tim17 4 n=1 Tax=Drosophila kikkawai TaxID=30033 RepID=A0A6P4I5Z9_DROKI|nr:probable mitochondrial import inner membrane translocase subunit Tim17 4 [Drosophila kikkawai]